MRSLITTLTHAGGDPAVDRHLEDASGASDARRQRAHIGPRDQRIAPQGGMHDRIGRTKLLDDKKVKENSSEISPIPGLRLWTDDFNNLVQILK